MRQQAWKERKGVGGVDSQVNTSHPRINPNTVAAQQRDHQLEPSLFPFLGEAYSVNGGEDV